MSKSSKAMAAWHKCLLSVKGVTNEQRMKILDLHTFCIPAGKIARKVRLPQATVLAVIKDAQEGRK